MKKLLILVFVVLMLSAMALPAAASLTDPSADPTVDPLADSAAQSAEPAGGQADDHTSNKPAELGSGEAEESSSQDIYVKALGQGIVLNPEALEGFEDFSKLDGLSWVLESSDDEVANRFRTFSLKEDNGKLVLQYQGKKADGTSTAAVPVYLTASANANVKGDTVVYLIKKEDGSEMYEPGQLELNDGDAAVKGLRVSVKKVSGTGEIDDVWIPMTCLVLYEEPVTTTPPPASPPPESPTPAPTPEPTPSADTSPSSEDEFNRLLNELYGDKLRKYQDDKSARVVLKVDYNGEWTVTRNKNNDGNQFLPNDFSGLITGSNGLIWGGFICLMAVSVCSIGISIFLIIKKRR